LMLLGGGGPQTAFGMRLWAESVGLAGWIGPDFSSGHRRWLEQMDIDMAALHIGAMPTLHAAQEYRPDDDQPGELRRHHRWLSTPEAVAAYTHFTWKGLPEAYQAARGYHFGIHPGAVDWPFFTALRQNGALLSLELFAPAPAPPEEEFLRALLSLPEIISMTRKEAHSLIGPGPDGELIQRLAGMGARLITLRLGDEGSIIYSAAEGRGYHLQAYPVPAIETTGAGNAYCGAFLAAHVQGDELLQAGYKAAAAASLVIEQPGLPDDALPRLKAEARRRYEVMQAGHPPGQYEHN
jgi:cytidine kinase